MEEIRTLPFDDYLSKIRQFTREDLRPIESQVDDSGDIPVEIVERMQRLGLFGITLPEAYGGLNWSMEQQVRLTFEFTQTLAVFRSRFSTTIGLASQMLLDHGTDSQRNQYLPEMAKGNIIGAAAVTEPEAGSDAGSVKTTARRDGDHYVLNGQKKFISNAAIAGVILVLARTNLDSSGHRGTSMFIVPRDTPGLSVRAAPVNEMFGWRGSPTCEIDFENCRIPADNLIGGSEGNGLRVAFRGFNHARMHFAAMGVGQSERLLEESLSHAQARHQFGHPIGDFQLIEGLIADMHTDIAAGRSLALDVARAFDNGVIPATEIATAKYHCSEMACRVASRAMQILGGDSIVGGHIISRIFRDTRVGPVAEGASQVLQGQIARALKGAQREPVNF